MDDKGSNVVGSKIDYLRELKGLIELNSLTVHGKESIYERVQRTCSSIEVDLGITPPLKNS